MFTGTELFGIIISIISIIGIIAVICWLDWIARTFTKMHGPSLRERLGHENPAANGASGERRNSGQRGSALSNQTQSHNSCPRTGQETL